jgi:triosephosphate isomerase
MTHMSRSSGRTPLVVGNWKMFKTSAEGAAFVRDLGEILGQQSGREVMVAPAFTGLYEAAKAAEGTCISVAAQDDFWEWEGAYTGEVSATMLADVGVKAAIIGHSERRQYFCEVDETVNRKVKAALAHQLIPIMCIGETLDENEAGITAEVVTRQLNGGLDGIDPSVATSIVIAYEPVWAIGTGRAATADGANAVIGGMIRHGVEKIYGGEVAQAIRILYGG